MSGTCSNCSGGRILPSGPMAGALWCFVKRMGRGYGWTCDSWKPSGDCGITESGAEAVSKLQLLVPLQLSPQDETFR